MNNTRIEEKYKLKKKIKIKLQKLAVTIILILIALIEIKKEPLLKEKIKDKIYTEDIISLKVKNIYQKYFINKQNNETNKPVSKESLTYKTLKEENEGIRLYFSTIYPTPVLESGVLVYLDDDKAIIEQIDGVRVTYESIDIKNYKLYDYIEKGNILGETKNKQLFLLFQKEGENVDYQNYV